MKKISFFRLFILVLALGLFAPSYAAPAKKKSAKKSAKKTNGTSNNTDLHFISMWGGGGYSGILPYGYTQSGNLPLVTDYSNAFGLETGTLTSSFNPKFVGSGGGLIGFGYELHHKKLIFSVGPEFRLINSADKLQFTHSSEDKPYDFVASQKDYGISDGVQMLYRFDNLRETQMAGQVMLPIMVGANLDRYYFLAGAKIGYTVFANWQHKGNLTTNVYDPKAMDPEWADLPHHWVETEQKLQDHPAYVQDSRKGSYHYGLDATVSAEFGINLNEFCSAEWNEKNEDSRHPWRMRIGAFIDYGIPMMKAANMDDPAFAHIGYPGLNDQIASRSLMQRSWVDKNLSSLLVGVKFTALFQLNKPKVPNPQVLFHLTNAFTNNPIAGGKVAVQPEPLPGKKPRKAAVKTMKGGKEAGFLKQRYVKGNYRVYPAGNAGYLDQPFYYKGEFQTGEYINYEVTEDYMVTHDTLELAIIPAPRLYLYVHDAATEQLINATATFDNNSRKDNQFSISSVATDKFIYVSNQLRYGDNYTARITAPEHHDTIISVSNLYDTVQVYLRPIKRIRRTLILKNMYFATDKTDILAASEGDLMTLYNFLAENPKVRVLITGHTDSQGTDAYNQKLSEGRSASVKAEMVKRGIDESRMETDGKGESEPIDTNETEEGRQNNRRVQVTVINAEDAEVDVY